MSWKFPDKYFSSSGVMNTEDTNEAMRSSVEEITGQLGEQNFARNAFTTSTDYEKDIAYRHAKLEVDVKGAQRLIGAGNPESFLDDPNTAVLNKNLTWQSIETQVGNNPFRYNFVSRGGLLFVTARLWGAQFLAKTGGLNQSPKLNPVLFALRINGALVPESVDGNLDNLNYEEDYNTGNTGVFSVNIDFVLPTVPGDTTVELVAQVRPQRLDKDRFVIGVGSRALILWEISN
tara:strand:+ start:2182 stop:2880 length:699 start_codon:yes stop_codon:yes gene_type:complete